MIYLNTDHALIITFPSFSTKLPLIEDYKTLTKKEWLLPQSLSFYFTINY